MKVALVCYWIAHITLICICKSGIELTTGQSMALLLMNYSTLAFLGGYPMFRIYVYQERVDHKMLWYFLGSYTVRWTVFLMGIISQVSLAGQLSIYGFGLLMFLLLEKSFGKLKTKYLY